MNREPLPDAENWYAGQDCPRPKPPEWWDVWNADPDDGIANGVLDTNTEDEALKAPLAVIAAGLTFGRIPGIDVASEEPVEVVGIGVASKVVEVGTIVALA